MFARAHRDGPLRHLGCSWQLSGFTSSSPACAISCWDSLPDGCIPGHLPRTLTDFYFDQRRNAETRVRVLPISGPLHMHATWRKELIMSSRSGASLSGNAKWNHGLGKRRAGRPSMSESQTQAYLTARDVLRRVQRSSSQHFQEVRETDTRGRSSTTQARYPSVESGIEPMGERA